MHAHPLNVQLHVLLGAALNLLLHFPHQRLHVHDALLGDAAGDGLRRGGGGGVGVVNTSHLENKLVCVGGQLNSISIKPCLTTADGHFLLSGFDVVAGVEVEELRGRVRPILTTLLLSLPNHSTS